MILQVNLLELLSGSKSTIFLRFKSDFKIIFGHRPAIEQKWHPTKQLKQRRKTETEFGALARLSRTARRIAQASWGLN